MRKTDTLPDLGLQLAAAFVLLTRLPLPALPARAFADQSRAVWAYALVGLVIGGLAAAIGVLALWAGLGPAVAAGLALATQIALSGAMHEDGLADTADGLWGGHDAGRRLEIMKDSAIGSYGVLALVVTLGLRWIALATLLPLAPLALPACAALSRGLMPALMGALPHARASGLSHGVGQPSRTRCAVALVLGLGLGLGLLGQALLGPAVAALIVVALLGRLARARIGGQTGDILGAAQQLCELVLLLGLTISLAS